MTGNTHQHSRGLLRQAAFRTFISLFLALVSVLGYAKESVEQKVTAIREEAFCCKLSDSSKRMKLAYKLLNDFPEYPKARILGQVTMAEFYHQIGRKTLAYKMLDSLFSIEKDSSYSAMRANFLLVKADLLNRDGKYSEALQSYLRILNLCQGPTHLKTRLKILLEIGNLHRDISNYLEAIRYNKLVLAENMPAVIDTLYQIRAYNNLGYTFILKRDLDSAQHYLDLGIGLAKRRTDRIGKLIYATLMGNCGEVMLLRGKTLAALPYLDFDIRQSRELENWDSYVVAVSVKARTYQQLGKYHEALKLLLDAELTLSNKTVYWVDKLDFFKLKALSLQKLGRYQEAYFALNEYDSLKVGALLLDMQKTNGRLKSEYDYQLQELEAIATHNQLEDLRVQRTYLTVGIGLMLLLLLYVLVLLLQKTRLAKELSQKNSIIDSQNEDLVLTTNTLEDVLEQKTQIMHLVSHDLKGPFNRVAGLLDLMQLDPEQAAEYSNLAKLTIKDGNAMIHNLLENAALQAGEKLLAPKHFMLVSTLTTLVNSIRPQAQFKKIEIRFDVALDNDQELYHDQLAFTRVIENLISNAIKFSPLGSQIVISTSIRDGNRVLIAIKDQGPGFSEEDKARVFRPFIKATAKPTGGEASTGLGMSIVWQLSRMMGAELYLDSKPNEGSTISILLPINQPQ